MRIKHKNLGTVNKNMIEMISEPQGNGKERVMIMELYFSYETLVSFSLSSNGDYDGNGAISITVTRKNDWSTTTGKLLNYCEPDKTKRVDENTFRDLFDNAMKLFHE